MRIPCVLLLACLVAQNGCTALMLAAIMGFKQCVSLLLINGAQPDLTDKVGRGSSWGLSRCGAGQELTWAL